jgi:cytochrome oxidase assembly protein ShyY1
VRAATKHWLFLILLAATLAVLVALVLWQMAKARREAPSRQEQGSPSPASVTPTDPAEWP